MHGWLFKNFVSEITSSFQEATPFTRILYNSWMIVIPNSMTLKLSWHIAGDLMTMNSVVKDFYLSLQHDKRNRHCAELVLKHQNNRKGKVSKVWRCGQVKWMMWSMHVFKEALDQAGLASMKRKGKDGNDLEWLRCFQINMFSTAVQRDFW